MDSHLKGGHFTLITPQFLGRSDLTVTMQNAVLTWLS